jgi:hypothetical protein
MISPTFLVLSAFPMATIIHMAGAQTQNQIHFHDQRQPPQTHQHQQQQQQHYNTFPATNTIAATAAASNNLIHSMDIYHTQQVQKPVAFEPPANHHLRDIDSFDVRMDNNQVRQFHKSHQLHHDHHFVGKSHQGDTLHVLHNNGAMTGSMVLADESVIYQFRPDALGTNFVTMTNTADFPLEEGVHIDTLRNGKTRQRRRLGQKDVATARTMKNITTSTTTQSHRTLQGLSVMDMMVLWTQAAECENSFMEINSGCELSDQTYSNMQDLINLAIEETNVAFYNSGIPGRLRLVHSYREFGYVESDLQGALNYIGNGLNTDISALRVQHGADAVSIIVSTQKEKGSCGLGALGYPMPSPDSMFSAVSRDCATGYYSFGHELAHNMGCNHDRGSLQACQSVDTNFGYRDPSGTYRDIMSYDCTAGQCDNVVGNDCNRRQYYSNPGLLYGIEKMGDDRNNCAAQINAYFDYATGFKFRVVQLRFRK